MDVTSESSVAYAYQRAVLEYGGVDVLVSNAGIAHSAPLDELSLEEWNAARGKRHRPLPGGARSPKDNEGSGTGGSLVFIATKNVTAPGKDFGAYSASKAAQAQLARVLALEGAPFGIRSNIVNPTPYSQAPASGRRKCESRGRGRKA
jgi:NAD(P)-dependent dehydrogenase (short-subunit alcohol dehydrogenase family)